MTAGAWRARFFPSLISIFEMRENPSSTTPKISFFIFALKKREQKTQTGKKWSIFEEKECWRQLLIGFFFVLSLVACYWFAFLIFLSFGFLWKLQSPLRMITIRFVPNPFAWLWLIFFFCSFNASFYQINPLGIAIVLLPFSSRFNFCTFRHRGAESHANTNPNICPDKSLVTHEMGHENMKWKFKFANKNLPQQCEFANNHKEYFHFIFPRMKLVATEATAAPPTTHCQMELTLVYFCTLHKQKTWQKKIHFLLVTLLLRYTPMYYRCHFFVSSYFLIRTLNSLTKRK